MGRNKKGELADVLDHNTRLLSMLEKRDKELERLRQEVVLLTKNMLEERNRCASIAEHFTNDFLWTEEEVAIAEAIKEAIEEQDDD